MESLPRMKPLSDYDVSVKTGFLPTTAPLRRLPNPYFKPWEDMMDDFNGLLLAGKLREKVHKVMIVINLKLIFSDFITTIPAAFIRPYKIKYSGRIQKSFFDFVYGFS